MAGAGAEEEEGVRRPRPLPVKALLAALVAIVLLAALAAVALFGTPNRERAPLKLDRPRAVERGPYLPAPER